MGDPIEFEGWELLHSSDTALFLAPNSAGDSKPSGEIEADSDNNGTIKSDYFTLGSSERYTKRAASEGGRDREGLAVSANPIWVDPDSDPRCLDRPRGEVGFAGTEFPLEDPDAFRSDELPEDDSEENKPDNQNFLPDSGTGELFGAEDSKTEVGFEGIDSGHQDTDENDKAGSGETEGIEGSETGDEAAHGLGYGESVRREHSTGSLAGMGGDGDGNSENPVPCEGEKREMLWLKLPLDLLKFCVSRVRPVWSISIAATIVGIVMLGRRLYKMKHKRRNIPLKVCIDDKKASQFMARAARLNEAFSVVRRASVIRSLPPANGVTPWPVVGVL